MRECKGLILMLGPDIDSKGGISSVVRNYQDSGFLNSQNVVYIPTWVEGGGVGRQLFFIKALFIFFKKIAFEKVSLVHVHVAPRGSFYRKSLIALFSRIFSVPVIFHVHAGEIDIFYNASSWIGRYIIRKVLALSSVVLCLSDGWGKCIVGIQPMANVIVLHNYVNKIGRGREGAGKGYDLVFLGRIGAKKRIYDLVDVVASDSSLVKRLKIAVGGDGDVNGFLGRVRELGVERCFEYAGWITGDKKNELIRSSRFVILPSYAEGMPMCLLEAMSAGIPIISTAVGGVPELIKDGVNGYIFPAGDKQALHDILTNIVAGNADTDAMGRESMRIYEENFAPDIVLAKLSVIYEKYRAN